MKARREMGVKGAIKTSKPDKGLKNERPTEVERKILILHKPP